MCDQIVAKTKTQNW